MESQNNHFNNFNEFLDFLERSGYTPEFIENNKKIMSNLFEYYISGNTDDEKNKKFEKDKVKLKEELDDISFDHDLDEDQKNKIFEYFVTWKKTINNKIFIENLKNVNVKIDNRVLINNIDFGSQVDHKSTLHFINCEKVSINVYSKVNHITLEKCNDMNIRTIKGSISGLDCIRCNQVSHVFDQYPVYYIDISKSNNCNYYIPENVALETTISVLSSMNLLFCMVCSETRTVKDKYHTNQNLFDIYKKYNFIKEDKKVALNDISHEVEIFNALQFIHPVMQTQRERHGQLCGLNLKK